MDSNYIDFDSESRKLIKELAKKGDKFNKLINKLQVVKERIVVENVLTEVFSKKMKKQI